MKCTSEVNFHRCGMPLIHVCLSSTLHIGIAMVFVFSPYIMKFSSCFQLTFNDFTAHN